MFYLSILLDHDVVVVAIADAEDVGSHGIAGTRLGKLPLGLLQLFRSWIVSSQPKASFIEKISLFNFFLKKLSSK